MPQDTMMQRVCFPLLSAKDIIGAVLTQDDLGWCETYGWRDQRGQNPEEKLPVTYQLMELNVHFSDTFFALSLQRFFFSSFAFF